MTRVLDALALMAYLEKEPGFEKVKDLLTKAADSEKGLLMTTVNFGEVCYILRRDYGVDESEKIIRLIETFPIEFIDIDLKLAHNAAVFKAEKKLPFVDCFAAALAKLRKAELVTADKDFKAVEGEVKILWL